MGEKIDSILELPSKYDEMSSALVERVQDDFSHFGIQLTHLYINAITPPPEVQKAIDDRSRMGVFEDMDKLMQMKAAMAMEKATEAEGGAGAGMGAGMGIMMPAMFAQYFSGAQKKQGSNVAPETTQCPECRSSVPLEAKFCHECGHQLVVFNQCVNCDKNLAPNAKFCSRCGQSVADSEKIVFCEACGAENLKGAKFCNECGEGF
jgi:membrane protease subunit (stomatin/prohibitin family)